MAQKHLGAPRKKARAMRAKAEKLKKALNVYTYRLRDIQKKIASARELNQRTCEELARRYAKSEKATAVMEGYYNERIEYYKSLYVSCCDSCLEKRKESLELREKYAHSLKQIRMLQYKVELEELKKSFQKPPLNDQLSTGNKKERCSK
eukprot:jgi/Antlo1/560/2323